MFIRNTSTLIQKVLTPIPNIEKQRSKASKNPLSWSEEGEQSEMSKPRFERPAQVGLFPIVAHAIRNRLDRLVKKG